MRIKFETKVNAPILKVWEGFNKELFLKLNPPFPLVSLQHFDGCLTGDKVEIVLDFLLFKQLWISEITNHQIGDAEIWFIDKGSKLPFFLGSWEHRHGLTKANSGTIISDEIKFTGPIWLPDLLIYPLLYLQFLYRKPVYKKVFKAN